MTTGFHVIEDAETEVRDTGTPVFPLAPGVDVAFEDTGLARLLAAQDLRPGMLLTNYEVVCG